MNLFSKLFGKADKNKSAQTQDTDNTIDLQKVYPRIKGLFTDENPDLVTTPTVMKLTLEESPVIKPFAEGVGICYMIDKGDNYQIIQHRQLSDTITIEKLHDAE